MALKGRWRVWIWVWVWVWGNKRWRHSLSCPTLPLPHHRLPFLPLPWQIANLPRGCFPSPITNHRTSCARKMACCDCVLHRFVHSVTECGLVQPLLAIQHRQIHPEIEYLFPSNSPSSQNCFSSFLFFRGDISYI
jgi:hypothetical protein